MAARAGVTLCALQALGAALCLVAGHLPGTESVFEQRLARQRQVFHSYRLLYSDVDRDQLAERIYEEGQGWGATNGEVSQIMREFYDRQ